MFPTGMLSTALVANRSVPVITSELEVYLDFGNRISWFPSRGIVKSITPFSWPGGAATFSAASGYGLEPFPYGTDINNGYLDLSGGTDLAVGYSDFLTDPSYTGLRRNWTLEIWARPNSTITVQSESTTGTAGLSGQKYLAYPPFRSDPDAGAGISLGTNGISVYEHANGHLPCLASISSTISSTDFSQIVIAYNNNQPTIYLNGSAIRTGLTSARSGDIHAPNLFGWFNYGDFTGDLAVVMLYNKVLSADEITTNFNAYRNRFGI